jgi:hypothetical protein
MFLEYQTFLPICFHAWIGTVVVCLDSICLKTNCLLAKLATSLFSRNWYFGGGSPPPPFGHPDKTVASAAHFELTRQTLMKIIHIQNNIKTHSKTRLCFYCWHHLWRWKRQSVSKRRYIEFRHRGITQIFYCWHHQWRWKRQSVPKRRYIEFRHRGITQFFCCWHQWRWKRQSVPKRRHIKFRR